MAAHDFFANGGRLVVDVVMIEGQPGREIPRAVPPPCGAFPGDIRGRV